MTNSNLHAHVSTYARDCDGPIGSGYTIRLNEAEIAESQQAVNDFHDITFRERVMCSIVSMTGGEGTLTVDSEPGGWATRLNWHQTTEEGFREATAIFCEDDCE